MNLGRRFCNIINIFLASIRRRFLHFLLSSARSVWRQIRLKTLQTRPKLSGLKVKERRRRCLLLPLVIFAAAYFNPFIAGS